MRNLIKRFSGSKLLVAGLLVGGSLGTFGYAAATSSPSTTVFYACLNVRAGTMNSINTTGAPKCGKGNANTSWNAIGPKGDTGSQGVAGQQGAKGDTGVRGALGPKGDTGTTGPQGVKGDSGLQGPKGDQGIQGWKGDNGVAGPGAFAVKGSACLTGNANFSAAVIQLAQGEYLVASYNDSYTPSPLAFPPNSSVSVTTNGLFLTNSQGYPMSIGSAIVHVGAGGGTLNVTGYCNDSRQTVVFVVTPLVSYSAS